MKMNSDPSIQNESLNIDDEIDFLAGPKKLLRRNSCHCSKCGKLSKFEAKTRENETTIKSKDKSIKKEEKLSLKLHSRRFLIQ